MATVGMALAALAVSGGARAQAPAAIPVQNFFAPAKMQDATLSPSGRWMAALTSVPGRRVGLSIVDLEGKDSTGFIEASPKDDVIWVRWVTDDWLVFRVNTPDDRSRSSLFKGGGLLALKRDGSSSRMLITREYEMEDPFQRKRYLDPSHYFMALGRPGTTEIIIGQDNWTEKGEYTHTTPKVMDIATYGVRTMEVGQRASGWWFDAAARPRVASATREGMTTFWWADKTGAWREISKVPQYERVFTPYYVDGDDALVVTTGDATGSTEVRRFDFTTGKPGKDIIVSTPGFNDRSGARRERATGEVLGIGVTTDAYTPIWFSPVLKTLQAKVDARFPGSVNVINCQPCDGKSPVLIYSYSDTDPGSFVLYRPQADKWQLLGEARPDIDVKRMHNLELHRTKARDGADLPVWVTLPDVQTKTKKPAPTVVLVHGGPFARGTEWRWNGEAQFLASRGYVVVEPEFRGSTGYGYDHYRAGFKQWGRAMQDDISDALKFAVAQGWADKDKVCIMGASYGGYAALMGLVKDPDQYRCGVAHAAVSDPRFLYDFHWSDGSEESRRYSLPLVLGDPQKDAAILAAGSALDQAARIKAPLLLSHGSRDRRVPIEHAERMLEALRKNGKTVEWVPYPEEGHSFSYLNNEVDYYTRVEAFLAKYLK